MDYGQDSRIVMTLDAGGTNLKFSAIRGINLLAGPIFRPAEADHLDHCLGNMVRGFRSILEQLPQPPVAISFAFPGPADYPSGVIMNVGNMPGFRGAVPLGPILEEEFGIPVFLNNDGDLFVYGEALAGLLPEVNHLLSKAGSPKRYKNLFGLTLGTGLGGGVVVNGELLLGDNSNGGEVWLLRNRLDPSSNAEEGASIRAVRRAYAESDGLALEQAPEPKEIFEIGMGRQAGNQEAAREAFSRLGAVAGDVLAQALTLVDGLAVIGGGIANAYALFMPSLVEAANDTFEGGGGHRRLVQQVYNLEEPTRLQEFVAVQSREVEIPGSTRRIRYDSPKRTGVGITRLGTNRAVAVGAYAFALHALDRT